MKNLLPLERVSFQTVEALLADRPKDDGRDCKFAELVAASVDNCAPDEEQAAAQAHLDICAECRNAVEILREFEARSTASGDLTAKAHRISPRRRRFWIASAAAVLIIGSGLLVRVELQAPVSPEASGLTAKGEADAVYVAAKRGTAKFAVRPLDKLENGDAVGFFYSAERDGFLAVFNIDDKGIVTRLFPVRDTVSAPIRHAARAPLSDGAIVQAGHGCEWVVAVFSDRPLDLNQVAGFLGEPNARGAAGACDFDPKVPGARSVAVVPFTR